MHASVDLLPELDDMLKNGPRDKRADALKRITGLFVGNAESYNDEHIRFFDDVFGRLIEEIETKARAELARRLAPIANAPAGVVRQLARDTDITVAGPLLTRSERLGETDLLEIARSRSQAHLLAISSRGDIGAAVTDVLVQRGDRDVVRAVADNARAKLSDGGFSMLVKRAESDGILAEKVGQRPDIPPRLFHHLLMQATEVVQSRLLAKAKPETVAEIRRVLTRISDEVGAGGVPRNYHNAMQAIRSIQQAGELNEPRLTEFAQSGQFEQTAAALSVLCGVPIEVVDRLLTGDRPDPVLILCKAMGFIWPTARAVITATPAGKAISSQGLDAAFANFERLMPTTASRVMRFWQLRQEAS
jgi:uncharacterized protein (DUF2336 family)